MTLMHITSKKRVELFAPDRLNDVIELQKDMKCCQEKRSLSGAAV